MITFSVYWNLVHASIALALKYRERLEKLDSGDSNTPVRYSQLWNRVILISYGTQDFRQPELEHGKQQKAFTQPHHSSGIWSGSSLSSNIGTPSDWKRIPVFFKSIKTDFGYEK